MDGFSCFLSFFFGLIGVFLSVLLFEPDSRRNAGIMSGFGLTIICNGVLCLVYDIFSPIYCWMIIVLGVCMFWSGVFIACDRNPERKPLIVSEV